jgi:hypothetical protein
MPPHECLPQFQSRSTWQFPPTPSRPFIHDAIQRSWLTRSAVCSRITNLSGASFSIVLDRDGTFPQAPHIFYCRSVLFSIGRDILPCSATTSDPPLSVPLYKRQQIHERGRSNPRTHKDARPLLQVSFQYVMFSLFAQCVLSNFPVFPPLSALVACYG